MKIKVKFDVKIDCYSNGVGVTIRDKKQKNKVIGNKVFEGKGYMKRESNWIENIIKEAEKEHITKNQVQDSKVNKKQNSE